MEKTYWLLESIVSYTEDLIELSLCYRHDDQNDWNIIPELSGHRGPGWGVSTFASSDQI